MNVAAPVTIPGQEGTIHPGPHTASVSKEELLQYFSGWEPDVQEMMKVRSFLFLARTGYNVMLTGYASTSERQRTNTQVGRQCCRTTTHICPWQSGSLG